MLRCIFVLGCLLQCAYCAQTTVHVDVEEMYKNLSKDLSTYPENVRAEVKKLLAITKRKIEEKRELEKLQNLVIQVSDAFETRRNADTIGWKAQEHYRQLIEDG